MSSDTILLDGVEYPIGGLPEDIQHVVGMLDEVNRQLTAAQLEVVKCQSTIQVLREVLRDKLKPA